MTTITDEQLLACASRVSGKVVLITGAASGIGKETASLFARHGAKILIGDVDVKGGEQTVHDIEAHGGTAVFRKCDVTSWDDQLALFEFGIATFGAVDIVIPNAGILEAGVFETMILIDNKPCQPSTKTLDVNLTAVAYTTYLSLHYLKLNRKDANSLKALILIGSMASWQAVVVASLYAASKHAVLGLMRSQALWFQRERMRIAVIHPWFIDTPLLPVPVKLFLAGIPMTPIERVAGAIFYAASGTDEALDGACVMLPDEGPVFRIEKELLKEGVYEMISRRVQRAFSVVDEFKYVVATCCGLGRILRVPLLVGVVGLGLGVFARGRLGGVSAFGRIIRR